MRYTPVFILHTQDRHVCKLVFAEHDRIALSNDECQTNLKNGVVETNLGPDIPFAFTSDWEKACTLQPRSAVLEKALEKCCAAGSYAIRKQALPLLSGRVLETSLILETSFWYSWLCFPVLLCKHGLDLVFKLEKIHKPCVRLQNF